MSTAQGRVGVISNPASGHNRDQFDAIRAQLESCPGLTHVVTQSPAEIDTALAQLAAADVEVLAINGGDGTNSAILGRVLETRPFAQTPLVALLPAGTANMNAGDVGIRGSLTKAVTRFCKWCASDRKAPVPSQQRSLLKVECPGEEPRYTMFIGAGAVIHGTEYAHENIHSRAVRDDFSVALGTARTVWGVLR
ncbi:MAG: acylglycerol kinase family protein, partial [Halioglobus sp.]|nr:acylglycerol kinase family protein [Halioglobus sp.]